ncbi:hypothetical protein G7092_28030 [Mucilaginibacter sp. HC2]|uniref:hypothetical protein n=1 Tax=Mucilaginibacter inviolabilis TaxID=2714892 RepID=UPI00140C105F|nr:hypothetical protein [Mucilaginibacter inviolabilis]NHA07681.1 hypothetical protein [Mucilaginibacter inviolabilis]
MKKILLISAGSLLAIGLLFGRFIGRFFVDKLDNKDTSVNDGQAFADKYINNCDSVSLVMSNYKDSTSYFKVKGKSDLSSADNTAYVYQHKLLFYDEAQKKFFCIFYFFNKNTYDEVFGHYAAVDMDKKQEKIIGMVNKTELADPTYGTKEKPIPVLYFHSPTADNAENDSFFNIVQETHEFKGDAAQFKAWLFHYNAWHYLSYIKTKEDFKKMFGDTKS